MLLPLLWAAPNLVMRANIHIKFQVFPQAVPFPRPSCLDTLQLGNNKSKVLLGHQSCLSLEPVAVAARDVMHKQPGETEYVLIPLKTGPMIHDKCANAFLKSATD